MTELPKERTVLYERRGSVAVVTLNRPQYRNAQNSQMLYALDDAFCAASSDDDVKVVVLRGAGACFSAGHDIGSPGRDVDESWQRKSLWWDHTGTDGIERRLAREEEVYLGLCRRWREFPKPTIAMVHGYCLGAGLMLAWVCDLIMASEDAQFADPVILMGAPGVEYFAHPWEMKPRHAKEFLFLGERIDAARAKELGMVNRVFATDQLESKTMEIAEKIAEKSRFALALVKKSVNAAEDAMGLRTGMDISFGFHQLAHARSVEATGDLISGLTPAAMKTAASGESGSITE